MSVVRRAAAIIVSELQFHLTSCSQKKEPDPIHMSAYPVWCFTFSYSQHPFQRPTLQPICNAQSAQCFDSALPWIARTGQMDSRRGPPRHGTVWNGSDFHPFQKRWLAICKSANRLLVPEPHVRSQWGLRAARIREAVV